MQIMVTGATGYVGSRLATALLAEGHHVFAAARSPVSLRRLGWSDEVSGVALEASDPDSASAAFTAAGPVDVAYYLLHGIGRPGFRQADKAAAANVAAAATDAGVHRIVYLGGFVPVDDGLSDHLASRAEVAGALSIEGGPEVVWLRTAIILGAGSTSFEMLRYVGDRFPVIPTPAWMDNPVDPISIRDALYYLLAAADPGRVPAGAYDISGPSTTTYRQLLKTYARTSGTWHTGIPTRGIGTGLASRLAAVTLPAPDGLASDLVKSLGFPMRACGPSLRELVTDPPGGLMSVDVAIRHALSSRQARPVNALVDPHHLADSDPAWAGGDAVRIQRLARAVTPPIFCRALELLNTVPGPFVGALRIGLDMLLALTPKVDAG
jgi:uncharacterized protein YbjT (DUF2867 family)